MTPQDLLEVSEAMCLLILATFILTFVIFRIRVAIRRRKER
jgi:hypothetical protein